MNKSRNNDRDENKENLLEPDDNRVIANMNIEGMPWHIPGKPLYEENKESIPPLSKKELWSITLNALAAGLLIAFIFLGVFFLFIMFCIHIWF